MQRLSTLFAVCAALLFAPGARAEDPPAEPAPVEAADPSGASTPGVAELSSAEQAEQAASEYRRELRTVEEDVGDLKERVFRSKATLQLLKELVVEGLGSGARVVVWHVNRLGGGYSMESAHYYVDGRTMFSRVDPGGALDHEREIKVGEQGVGPGTHNLLVSLVLRGKGYKIFSYMRTYQFKLESSYTFQVEQGKMSVIRVITDSKGSLRNFVERPTIEYDERTENTREQ